MSKEGVIGLFGRRADHVSKGKLGEVAREVGLFANPIAESGTTSGHCRTADSIRRNGK
jgi:hypothetical protein